MLLRPSPLVLAATLSVASFVLSSPLHSQSADAALKLNQIQVIGTHNSYHAGISPNESKVWQEKYPDAYKSLDYQHLPLPQQFDAGVRQIELDVYADSKGGRYAHPSGPGMAKAAGLPADPDFDPNGVMLKPGFKVMHVQDIDYRSTCQPFVACLAQVREWSHAHPQHVPIFILVETKQGSPKNLKLTEPEPFTSETFDALDAEIRSVFPASEMITPDDVRGSYRDPRAGRTGWQLAEPQELLRQGRLPDGSTSSRPRLSGWTPIAPWPSDLHQLCSRTTRRGFSRAQRRACG